MQEHSPPPSPSPPSTTLGTRHFLRFSDLDAAGVGGLLADAQAFYQDHQARRSGAKGDAPLHADALANLSILSLFEKHSTRTRLSFELAVEQLGGTSVYMSSLDSQVGRGETAEDSAKVVASMVDGVVMRTGAHERLERFARSSQVGVVNALSHSDHPTQLLADLLTVRQALGLETQELGQLRIAWVGDGNNMCNTWIDAADVLGFELRVATPAGYEPERAGGPTVRLLDDPREAVRGAQVVNTDVWTSMGDEEEEAQRRVDLAPYQVGPALLSEAAGDPVLLHCLPAHWGEEVDPALCDGKADRWIWRQAENRLHTAKALLRALFAPKN